MLVNASVQNEEMIFANLYNLDSLKNVKFELENFKDKKIFELNLHLKEYGLEITQVIREIYAEAFKHDIKITVSIGADDLEFKVADLEQFIEIEDELQKNNSKLEFTSGYEKRYRLNEILTAQAKIDEVAEKINKTNASPLEKYLMAYRYLTSKVYSESPECLSNSRELVSVLNGDDIVCVGYSRLMQRLCKSIGIECYVQSSEIFENEQNIGGHSNNVVYIKDEKYGVDGLFYADACWDSVNQKKQHIRLYNYCLIPLSDVDKMKGEQVKIRKQDSFYYNMPDIFQLYKTDEFLMAKNFFHIDNRKDFIAEQSEELFSNNEIKNKACKKLSNLLKKENVPEDLYVVYEHFPINCSIEYMLALVMLGKDGEEELKKSIAECKRIIKLGKFYEFNEDERQKSYRIPFNLYESLEEMSEMDTSAQVRGGACSWADAKKEFDDIQKCAIMKMVAEKKFKPGQPISINVFKKALKSSLILEGLQKNKAEYETQNAIEQTERRSELFFEENAENCFRQSALSKRKQMNA